METPYKSYTDPSYSKRSKVRTWWRSSFWRQIISKNRNKLPQNQDTNMIKNQKSWSTDKKTQHQRINTTVRKVVAKIQDTQHHSRKKDSASTPRHSFHNEGKKSPQLFRQNDSIGESASKFLGINTNKYAVGHYHVRHFFIYENRHVVRYDGVPTLWRRALVI